MKLTDTEIKFMSIIWDNEPINSREVVKKCEEVFGWKKSTTYTFLKRLQNRGALVNSNTIVTSSVSKDYIQRQESTEVVKNVFNGSLPLFVTTFLSKEKISEEEYIELENMLKEYKGKQK